MFKNNVQKSKQVMAFREKICYRLGEHILRTSQYIVLIINKAGARRGSRRAYFDEFQSHSIDSLCA